MAGVMDENNEEKPEVLETLGEDDAYRKFLADDFDVNREASALLQSSGLSEQLAHIMKGISLLDTEISDQVSRHYEDLLSQATGTETLEEVLQTMHARIQSLMAAVERLRGRLLEPCLKIESQSLMLSRLHAACDTLRRVIRIQYLSKRLQTQLAAGVKDITKAAKTISELEETGSDGDLSGLEVYEREQRHIRAARQQVEKQAGELLQRGMEALNQSQVATALQVCHSLGTLQATVDSVLVDSRARIGDQLRQALDFEALVASAGGGGPGRPGGASLPTSTATFRASLWNNLERLTDHIYNTCAQIQHVHKVLVKKRDPATQVCFIDEVSSGHLLTCFWEETTVLIGSELTNASHAQSLIKQAFEGEYPRLLRLSTDLANRLKQLAGKSTDQQSQFCPEESLLAALEPFERSYLSRSLSRLFDPVNLMFSSETLPTKEEAESAVRTIGSELNVATVDAALCRKVARNVAKTVQLFCVKTEQLMVTGGEASQVIGPMSAGQTTNVHLVNLLDTFSSQLGRLLDAHATFPADARDLVHTSMENLDTLMTSALQPLLTSIGQAIEAIILTMHNEDFSSEDKTSSESSCSLYMKELQSFISRAVSDYLSPFSCKPLLVVSRLDLARRAVELFVRHAALVRPLGGAGRLRLASDCAQLELALSPLCDRLADLGLPFRLLRAFRPLLLQSPEHVAQSAAVGEVVPVSLVLHLLFSHGPAELRSPHHTAGWSVARYSAWLDQHPAERERLQLLAGALEAHVQQARAQGAASFAPQYPVMLQLLQRGLSLAKQ